MIIRPALAAAAAFALLAACQTPEAEAPASPAAEAAPAPAEAATPAARAWTTIAPGGDTLCATGTPYTFHVREGDASRVMIFLNGGGACWSGDLCDLNTEPTPYTPFAGMDSNDPASMGGVFDAANPGNPFAGWTQVFVSYCTGDAHLGARDVDYPASAGGTGVASKASTACCTSAWHSPTRACSRCAFHTPWRTRKACRRATGSSCQACLTSSAGR